MTDCRRLLAERLGPAGKAQRPGAPVRLSGRSDRPRSRSRVAEPAGAAGFPMVERHIKGIADADLPLDGVSIGSAKISIRVSIEVLPT